MGITWQLGVDHWLYIMLIIYFWWISRQLFFLIMMKFGRESLSSRLFYIGQINLCLFWSRVWVEQGFYWPVMISRIRYHIFKMLYLFIPMVKLEVMCWWMLNFQCLEEPQKLSLCGLDPRSLHMPDRFQDNTDTSLVNILKARNLIKEGMWAQDVSVNVYSICIICREGLSMQTKWQFHL